MARASIDRGLRPQYPVNRVYGQLYPEGENVADAIYFNEPGGLDFSSYLFNVPKNMTPYAKNWRLDRGNLVQRPGTSVVGPPINESIIGLTGFQTSDGTSYVIRISVTGIHIYNTTTEVWDACTGPAFTAASDNAHAYTTGWADKLMIQIDSGGNLYELDPATKTYVLITTTGSSVPSGQHVTGTHITTFAGRIIVCQADAPYRVAWSVKNDNTDWGGIGSGFEDLFSTPSGNADAALCVIPVTDDQAILVRANSIWLMATTGVADVPFRFSRLYDKIICRSPYGVFAIPGAAVVPGLDDIFIVSPSEITAIGTKIRPRYVNSLFHPERISGVYDEKRGDLVIGVYEGNQEYLNVIYRYSLADKGWTRDEYKTGFKLLAYSRFLTGDLAISALIGEIEELSGMISALGAVAQSTGVIFAGQSYLSGVPHGLRIEDLVGEIIDLVGLIGTGGGPTVGFYFVIREDPTSVQDYDTDFVSRVDSPTELWTGIIIGNNKPPSILAREKVTDAQLEYLLPNAPLEVDVDWSPDGGISWLPFSSGNVAGQIGVPSVLRFSHTFESAQPILRVATRALGNMRTSGFHVFVTDGGMENP